MRGQTKFDEFALVLLGGFILIGILMIALLTPPEFAPEAEPAEISIALQNGTSGSFELNISGKITNVTLRATGEIREWLKFSETKFDLIIDHRIVDVTVNVPASASAGKHEGTIIVKGSGGEVKVPVTIDVSVAKRLVSKPIILGDFTVSFVSGSKVIDSKENVFVSKGYFSSQQQNLIGVVDDRELPIITGGVVQLLIEETNRFGNLIVTFNGVKIYDQKTNIGEVLIPIDASMIKKTNTVEIKAGNPGFFFWGNTVYKLRSVKFSIDFRGTLSKEFEFSMQQNEIDNFDHFQLTYTVKDSSVTLPPLFVAINNQTIFSSVPDKKFFNRNFVTDTSGRKLQLFGENKILFEFREEAFYDISNAVLTVFTRSF